MVIKSSDHSFYLFLGRPFFSFIFRVARSVHLLSRKTVGFIILGLMGILMDLVRDLSDDTILNFVDMTKIKTWNL